MWVHGRGRGLGARRRKGLSQLSNLALAFLAAAGLAAAPAHAARYSPRHPILIRERGPVRASIVIDSKTGEVLEESNADALTYPASLTKMMTLYLTFKALNSGRLRLDQRLPVSAYAASRPPTKLGLRAGDTVRVKSLILGIVTRSANDAAVVLAEGIAGSDKAFARMMNNEARQLGMTRTHYGNASGLPDPSQMTTARDAAQLALALYHDFPREYHYFSTQKFVFRGQTIYSDDALLRDYPGADGVKTGYIHASGFNLVTSAVRAGHRLIGVVLGGRTAVARNIKMERLLDASFAELGVGPVMAASREPPRLAAARRPAPVHPHAARIAHVAARIAARLSPIARAEAAPVARRSRFAHDWRIQVGAFFDQAAARNAAREARALAALHGKPLQILSSAAARRKRLYRARVLDLTKQQAIRACIILHRHRKGCWAIRPTIRFASR